MRLTGARTWGCEASSAARLVAATYTTVLGRSHRDEVIGPRVDRHIHLLTTDPKSLPTQSKRKAAADPQRAARTPKRSGIKKS